MVYSLGAELQPREGMKLLSGYSYGATPISEDDVDNNLGSIAVVEHHLSAGVNKNWNENLSSTFSYVRGLHNSVQSSLTPNMIEAEFNMFYIQLSYRM